MRIRFRRFPLVSWGWPVNFVVQRVSTDRIIVNTIGNKTITDYTRFTINSFPFICDIGGVEKVVFVNSWVRCWWEEGVVVHVSNLVLFLRSCGRLKLLVLLWWLWLSFNKCCCCCFFRVVAWFTASCLMNLGRHFGRGGIRGVIPGDGALPIVTIREWKAIRDDKGG